MNKKLLPILVAGVMITMTLMATAAMAERYEAFGKPLDLYGYLTLNTSFHRGGDPYDTESGLQSALTTLLVEGKFHIADDLKLFASGLLAVDWVYDLKHDDRSWNDQLFSKSREKLYVDDEYWQLLKELHYTWTPGNFLFRVGKQIIKWGETDGFRLMDQINPSDGRRGMADVEFETSIIPIWLIKAEYFPEIASGWLQDLGFEVFFNPNADFIPNQNVATGNDVGGIWAPNVKIPLGGPYPNDVMYVGSETANIEEPDNWSEGREFGIRIKGIAFNSFITLNYFNGLDNSPITRSVAGPAPTTASDGRMIFHPGSEGFYPRMRFAGATISRDISPLKAAFLGNVSPVLRLESFYGFDNTFKNSLNSFEKFDEIRWAMGLDWKVKIPVLNPRTYFTVSPQFYHRKVVDYPTNYSLSGVQEDNYMTTLMLTTSYLHGKITPVFFWMHDVDNHADMYKLELKYQYSHEWNCAVGALLLDGQEPGKGFHVFENKDYMYFRISYRWG